MVNMNVVRLDPFRRDPFGEAAACVSVGDGYQKYQFPVLRT